jgi:hypothetical protein
MKWNRIAPVFLLLFPLHLANPAEGQKIVTHTRFQVLLGNLENQWFKAVQDKDSAALSRILSDDFEMWSAAPPGNPMPREEWQAAAFGRKLQSFELRQLAAKVMSPQIVITNFVVTETFEKDRKPQREYHLLEQG